MRLLAGVGTGKTHTLIARIGYLIEMLRVQPHRILALAFDNKGARELNAQLKKLKFPEVQSTTFHALSAKLLRQYWKSDFLILDRGQQREILNGILYPNELARMEAVIGDLESIEYQKPKSALPQVRLESIHANYQNTLRGLKALDRAGLVTSLLDLWEEDEGILEKCQARFDYILVDEYQDANAPQIAMVRKLAEKGGNLCVAGDPDQAIFNGKESDPKPMEDFPLFYPKAALIALTDNYRNPPNLLKGAENLIKNNSERLPKPLKAMAIKEGGITLWKNESEAMQLETIIRLIDGVVGSHSATPIADQKTGHGGKLMRLEDIAIMTRDQKEAKAIADELDRNGIPNQVAAPEAFWERREIADFMTNLDELKFLESYPEDSDFSEWVRGRVVDFARLGKWDEGQVAHLNRIVSLASAYDDKPIQEALFEFLDEVRTGEGIDSWVGANRINVLTLHAAKGLEFPMVMVTGLEEGNIPTISREAEKSSLDEERRLLYVGMTRTTRELHLFFLAKKGAEIQNPSRFLDEIGYANMAYGKLPEADAIAAHRREVRKSQMKLF